MAQTQEDGRAATRKNTELTSKKGGQKSPKQNKNTKERKYTFMWTTSSCWSEKRAKYACVNSKNISTGSHHATIDAVNIMEMHIE